MITVASINDIVVITKDRYAIVKDTAGVYRVVSLLRTTASELGWYDRGSFGKLDRTYTFCRSGCGRKEIFGQFQLKRAVQNYGKPATPALLVKLSRVVYINKATTQDIKMATTGKNDFNGLPLNTQLDPVKGGWIIASVGPGGLVFGTTPKVHISKIVGETELARLASIAPGTEFVLFKAASIAKASAVVTHTFLR
jgi:hypothetical protein